jgi:cystathionine beta-lyase
MADIWADPVQLASRRSVKYRKYPADVLPVWVAEMDVELAEPIRTVLADAVAASDTGYAHPGGLLESFAAFAERRYGWSVDAGRTLMMPDVMRGITETLRIVSRPGDAIVINTPAYPPFFAQVADVGRRIVESPLALTPDGYRLDLARLEDDFGAGARVYLMCNPHNPTGLVLDPVELAAIADLAERYRVRIIVDEIHAPLTYPGVLHTPFTSLDAPAARRSVTMVSASKAWNLAGLKCAVLVAGEDAWPEAQQISVDVQYGAGLFGVLANQAAFSAGEPWLDTVLDALDSNRRLVADLLAAHLPDVGYRLPDATYLAWLDFRRLDLGPDPAALLREQGRVALSDGPSFGADGHGFARLNLASAPERLAEAVRRMAEAVSAR